MAALGLAERCISQTFLQLSESMWKFCPIGCKEKCHVVIWGGFPKRGSRPLSTGSPLCCLELGWWCLESWQPCWAMRTRAVGMVQPGAERYLGLWWWCRAAVKALNAYFGTYFMFSITFCVFKPLIVTYLVPPGISSFTCPIQMCFSFHVFSISVNVTTIYLACSGPKPRNHASSYPFPHL